MSRIVGAKELDAVLRELPEELARKAVNNALLAGGRVVAREMRIRAPVNSEAMTDAPHPPGTGKRAIRARIARRSEMGDVLATVGGRASAAVIAGASPRAYWLRFIEFGWNLTRGRRKGSKRVIRHIPAKPFMRPAWESKKEEALDVIGRSLGEQIEKMATRLATEKYRNVGFSKNGRSILKMLSR